MRLRVQFGFIDLHLFAWLQTAQSAFVQLSFLHGSLLFMCKHCMLYRLFSSFSSRHISSLYSHHRTCMDSFLLLRVLFTPLSFSFARFCRYFQHEEFADLPGVLFLSPGAAMVLSFEEGEYTHRDRKGIERATENI